ncbi:MAG TPA: hypothetical protein VE935_00715 [Burkholderiales bacterium]|jgi:hypothetical protein|nr:hypothetical protein [Burkholderiales bacterium]
MTLLRLAKWRRRESKLAILLTAMRLWETRALLEKSRRVLADHHAPR